MSCKVHLQINIEVAKRLDQILYVQRANLISPKTHMPLFLHPSPSPLSAILSVIGTVSTCRWRPWQSIFYNRADRAGRSGCRHNYRRYIGTIKAIRLPVMCGTRATTYGSIRPCRISPFPKNRLSSYLYHHLTHPHTLSGQKPLPL